MNLSHRQLRFKIIDFAKPFSQLKTEIKTKIKESFQIVNISLHLNVSFSCVIFHYCSFQIIYCLL